MLQHIVRGSIIQSRVARYHVSSPRYNPSGTMLRQFAAESHSQPAPLSPSSRTSTAAAAAAAIVNRRPLQLTADDPWQHGSQYSAVETGSQLKAVEAGSQHSAVESGHGEGLAPGMGRHTLQKPHIAWADQPAKGIQYQAHAHAVPGQMSAMTLAAPGQSALGVAGNGVNAEVQEQSMLSTAACDNALFEPSASNQLGQSVSNWAAFAREITDALSHVQQEMEAFQKQMLSQFAAINAQGAEHLQLVSTDLL